MIKAEHRARLPVTDIYVVLTISLSWVSSLLGPAGLRQWPSVELHLLFLKIVHEQLCWLLLGSHMSPCAGPLPGLCSVCKYLQGQARDNLQQSVTPGQARPPEPELSPGHTEHRALSWCWWWHWDLIVSRSPGYQSRCPWRGLCTFQLYPRSSQTPAPWRVACALAWPELVNVRELGQWQRAKWNDITQVAEYFINPAAPAHRPLSETKQFYWTWIFFSFLIISN